VATLLIVFALIASASFLYADGYAVDDWLTFLFGFALAGGLGASLGLALSSLVVFFPAIERIQGPILRPLFWVSGILFTANGLPVVAREILLLNPLLHAVEFARTGWFRQYDSMYASAGYPLAWIITLSFFGVTLERVARRRLEVS
jgi:capsular polysaccharide transport system permease protein